MVSRGYREILGDRCQGILQADRCYWISMTLGASRAVEIFGTADKISEALTFDDFVELSRAIVFPRLIRITSFNEAVPSHEKSLEVSTVALNEPLADGLFAIDDFPRAGERIAFS
jgi:hypothetical protein